MFLAIAYILIGGTLSRVTAGGKRDPLFALENKAWVASSNNPIDRALCYWTSICGGFHFLAGTSHAPLDPRATLSRVSSPDQWTEQPDESDTWSEDERQQREIPQYVLDYAPYVHLYSKEKFWPGDLADHLAHTSQNLNFTELEGQPRTLANLDQLNGEDHVGNGRHIYLQSEDDVERNPAWLSGRSNIPNGYLAHDGSDDESTVDSEHRQTRPPHRDLRRRRHQRADQTPVAADPDQLPAFGRSKAPAILIVVPKANGVVDAFWFFFYSFNQAPKFLNIQFGNHIGDWEHTTMRFRNGVPESVACSEHFFGAAYAYSALEKYLVNDSTGAVLGTWSNRTALLAEPKRPVIYSAAGSHAMYARPGQHPYILPFHLLRDTTDRGPLWDPTRNLQAYTYTGGVLRAATRNPRSPTGWFDFDGRWGDKYYLLSDRRQYRFANQYHYLSGPWGPKYKNLMRESVCQRPEKCVVKDEVD